MEPPPLKSPTKPPLITPSASPPPPRYGAHVHRMSESAPPLKRQRTASTPRPMTPSSSSASQDPIDVLEQRKASTMRLLDFWDSLARYTRPLDEDDLVDVLTGEITRDVGVLRNSSKFNFGSLAAPVADYTSDEGSDTHEELDEDEYGVDELDAFQDDISEAGDSEAGALFGLDVGAKIVPLVTPLGPADADDLREFMEAEQKRRELYGSEDGDDDEHDSHDAVEIDEGTVSETRRYSDDPGIFTGNNADEREGEGEGEVGEREEEGEVGEEEVEEVEEYSATYGYYSDYVVPLHAASEDELDNWDNNATNTVRPVTKQEPEDDDDNDSDIEIVEVSPAPRPSPSHENDKIVLGISSKLLTPSEHTPKPPRQLYTPPQSNSSSGPFTTPTNENFIDLSTEPTPSPNSSVSDSSPVQSPSKKNSKRQAKNERNVIPRSKTTVDFVKRVQETPVRRIDLSKTRDNSSPVKATPKNPGILKSSPTKSTGPTSNLKPFVLLTPRKSSPQKSTTVSAHAKTQTEYLHIGSSNTSKGKSKARQVVEETKHRKPIAETKVQPSPTKRKSFRPTLIESSPVYEDNNLINMHLSSSPSKPLRSHLSKQPDDEEFFLDTRRTPEVATSCDISEDQQFLSPTFPSPPTNRKRKRTPSDVSMESPESNRREPAFSIGRRHPSNVSNRQMSTSRFSEDEVRAKHFPAQGRSSSRGRQQTPEWESGSDSDESDISSQAHHRRSRPPANSKPPSSYSYPALHPPYPASHHSSSHGYAPIPDPRAQLIITQAMQQLSALVGAQWIPPHQYHDDRVPRTPSHRRTSSRPPANPPFQTPTHHHHHHPYPYSYDPNLSHATLPPDSPDQSSPEKSSTSRRKSIVRRSRSKGRRVSFHLQDEEDDRTYDTEVGHSSPSNRRSSNAVSRQDEHVDRPRLEDRPKSSKGKGRAHTPYHPDSDPEHVRHSDTDLRGRPSRARGQTPGPSFESSRASTRAEHNQHSSGERPEKQVSRRKYRED